MKRNNGIMLVGVLLLSFLLFNGCKREKYDISFMAGGAPNEISFFEEIVTDFENETGITVKLIRQTTQTEQRKQSLLVALRGKKKDPDVSLVDVGWIGQFAASGWLLPLDEYDVNTDPFFQNVIELADTYDGQIIGLPLYVDAGLLYYRTDLLDKYGYKGPPETWSQLLEMAKTVQAGERKGNENFWGYVWQGAQYEGLSTNVVEYFSSAGGALLNDQNEPVVNSKENLQALRFMVSLIQEHGVSPPNTYTDMQEEEVRITFQNGNALFERNWPYAYGLHNAEDSAVRGVFGVAPLPHFTGQKSAACLGGWHVIVSAYSDAKEEAVEFSQYLTSADVQKKFALNLGWNPGREQVYSSSEIKSELPHLIELKDVFINAVPRPIVPYYTQLSQALQKHVNAALAGDKKPQQALQDSQEEFERIIRENT